MMQRWKTIAGTLALLAVAACSGQAGTDTSSSSTGKLSVSVLASKLTSSSVSAVTVKFTNTSTSETIQGSLTLSSSTWSSTFTDVPVGTYSVYAKATDSSGTTVYETSSSLANITVSAGASTAVTLVLQQVTSSTTSNSAPYFVSLYANEQTVDTGTTIQLVATAADPDSGDTLSFAWASASGGTFGTVTSTSTKSTTTWTPPSSGSFVITATVTDSAGSSASLSITITVSDTSTTGSLTTNVVLNNLPVVSSVWVANGQAEVGTALTLSALATDADGDAMTFAWAASCEGSFGEASSSAADAGTTSTTTFTPTATPSSGQCTFTVTVTDANSGQGTGSLVVTFSSATVGSGPSIYLNASTLDVYTSAIELRAYPLDGATHSTWSYSWTDGLASSQTGTFTAKTDSVSDGSDQYYTAASCAYLGGGDHVVTLAVTVTDSDTGLYNTASAAATLHCDAAWSFGILSDTQWTTTDDGYNPGTTAAAIIKQVDEQFISAGVKFVVAVGDLTDTSSATNMDIRAQYVQDLYNAGIGFFPLRGNHDSTDGDEFVLDFPQTQTGVMNATPSAVWSVTNADSTNNPPASVSSSATFTMGSNFSSPSSMTGKTYSFDYGFTRFVLLDQFDGTTNTIQAQQSWITTQLSGKTAGYQAFVFGHKGLITENHADVLFGSSPAVDQSGTDTFINSLANNGVRLYAGGHDHMHDVTKVWTTDATTNSLTQLTCASNSSKFYTPATTSNDTTYDVATYGHTRQQALAQELYRVGYYVVTVDGQRVWVDYYSAAVGASASKSTISTTPTMSFSWRQRFGYSLNGQEFLVAQGGSYATVSDSFNTTTAAILSGTNSDATTDGSSRAFYSAVNTGWAMRTTSTLSDIFTLWGMAHTMGSDTTDTYAVSVSYDSSSLSDTNAATGNYGLAVKDSSGNWVNAASLTRAGATATFVSGAYSSSYALGTYGIDPSTHVAWAVLDYNSDFAVAKFVQ